MTALQQLFPHHVALPADIVGLLLSLPDRYTYAQRLLAWLAYLTVSAFFLYSQRHRCVIARGFGGVAVVAASLALKIRKGTRWTLLQAAHSTNPTVVDMCCMRCSAAQDSSAGWQHARRPQSSDPSLSMPRRAGPLAGPGWCLPCCWSWQTLCCP